MEAQRRMVYLLEPHSHVFSLSRQIRPVVSSMTIDDSRKLRVSSYFDKSSKNSLTDGTMSSLFNKLGFKKSDSTMLRMTPSNASLTPSNSDLMKSFDRSRRRSNSYRPSELGANSVNDEQFNVNDMPPSVVLDSSLLESQALPADASFFNSPPTVFVSEIFCQEGNLNEPGNQDVSVEQLHSPIAKDNISNDFARLPRLPRIQGELRLLSGISFSRDAYIFSLDNYWLTGTVVGSQVSRF
jgi:hypothetical protein